MTKPKSTPSTFAAVEEAAKSGNWMAAKWLTEREERGGIEGQNFKAAQESLEAMQKLGRLEAVDGALIMALLTLAKAVDTKPANAQLWRQYLECLRILKSGNMEADAKDEAAEVLARLGAPIRDTARPKPKNARAGSGKSGGGTRATVHAVAEGSRRRRPRTTP